MKTLKEIEVGFMPVEKYGDWYSSAFIDALRESAQEWIKEKEETPAGYCPDCDKYLISWIKHFFNLEEEK